MIRELELRVFETSVPELSAFGSFKLPVVYFATNDEGDPDRLLSCPIIVDHANAKISLWSIHGENNRSTIEGFKNDPDALFEHPDFGQWAHCFIPCPDGTYLTFFETSSLGIRFDPKNSKAFLFDAPEVFWKDSHARTFSVTAYANEDASADYFYTAFLRVSPDWIRQIVNVRLAYDFSYWEPISASEHGTDFPYAPHATREVRGMVFNSFFNDVRYQTPERPGVQLRRRELLESAFLKAFTALQKIGWVSGEETPETHFEIKSGKIVFHSKVFESFVTRLKNASWGQLYCDLVCDKLLPWSMLLPGNISYFNIEDGENVQRVQTMKGSPAHFEFSTDRKNVYVSSHNFDVVCGCFKYFGPAAIDAFEITPEGLRKTGTFETPTGYRFTSHRAFSYGGKNYVATIGQPGRFFLIDGETMKEVFRADIIPSGIDSVPSAEMNAWIRLTNDYSKFTFFRPFEISEDGSTAFIPSETGLRHLRLFEAEKRFDFIGFENMPREISELLKGLKIINAHAYAVPIKP